jgi:hypothetical protein
MYWRPSVCDIEKILLLQHPALDHYRLFLCQLSETGRVTRSVPIEAVEFIVIVVAIKILIDYVLPLLSELPARRRRLFILEQIENPKVLPAPHALKDPIVRIRLPG